MGIRDNIIKLRKIFDVTQRELADVAGVTENAVSKWENGYAEPRMGAIERMAACYGLSKMNIIEDGGMDLIDPITKKPRRERMLPKGAKIAQGVEMAYVPLKGRVHAGTPVEAENLEGREQMVLIPQFLLDEDPECWAAESEGDCMNNIYPEGCIYVISPNKSHQNGKPEVWTIDGIDTVARRVYKTQNTLLLSPDSTNPENKDIVINADDDHYAEYDGRIVWFQSNGEVE